jgi:hypothetical protein
LFEYWVLIPMPPADVVDHVAHGDFPARDTLKIRNKSGGRLKTFKALLRDSVFSRLKVPLDFLRAWHRGISSVRRYEVIACAAPRCTRKFDRFVYCTVKIPVGRVTVKNTALWYFAGSCF